MTLDENRLLTKMKVLIRQNKRRFQIRNDRYYMDDLLEIGLTPSEAWGHILSLNSNFYFYDPKAIYRRELNTLIFKKIINGYSVYIKLKLECSNDNEMVVCLSFHIDKKRSDVYEMSVLQ